MLSHFGGRAICGDDAAIGRGKPNPDIFLYAAHTGLGLQGDEQGKELLRGVRQPGPEHDGKLLGREGEFLVFEDAVPGVQAALSAGMKGASMLTVVWVPDENVRVCSPASPCQQY